MFQALKKATEGIVLHEMASWMNQAGRVFGNPLEIDNLDEMREKYLTIVGKLNKDGCNFVLILAKLVEVSLIELEDLHKERDSKGVN